MILVLSTADDEHARVVLEHLAALGAPAVRVDTAEFPARSSITARFEDGARPDLSLQTRQGRIALSEVRAAWWRRPQPVAPHPDVTEPDQARFAMNECVEALAGLWHSLDAFWINVPHNDQVAHRKLLQLKVAGEVGLPIPRTCVTSDPRAAREFAANLGPGRTIYKAFSATLDLWRETRVLRPEELALADAVAYAPVIFQEYVQASCDLRVTVVGDQVFAAAIHTERSRYPVDFRMDMAGVRIEPTTLPPEIEQGLLALMRRLGLVYGAVDLRRRPDGEHVFLEVNPAGQWLFVEQATRQPIARTLAEHLAAGASGAISNGGAGST